MTGGRPIRSTLDLVTQQVRIPTAVRPPIREIWFATDPDLRRAPGIRAAMAFLAERIAAGRPIVAPEARRPIQNGACP